jgi:predicted Zn-dependent protease
MQEYVYVSMILKEYDNALKMSKEMITLYDNANYYSLVADIYYTMKSYKRALKYYNISYSKKNNENVLLTISILNYTYLNNKENAILRLENYVKEHNCSKLICSKLFSYYRLNGDTDKMTTMLKTLYEKYKNSYTKDSALKISTLLIKLLEEKDINEAINFLEKNNIDNETLLRLYGETNQYDKAHKNLTKEYQETKNKNTLGKIAIVEFEMSKNKESILKKVFQKFDIALQNNMNDNANFENYYGYLLVDYNIDIKKGKKLIEKALSKYPNNYAYMDSIAWAYYKSKDCKNAYKYMSKVVKQVGLENEEIKEHWNKIKGCKK